MSVSTYPGHPIQIALEIMAAFPDYRSANELTERGWAAALSSMKVSGSGGAVHQGLEVLKYLHEGASPETAYKAGCKMWEESRKGGDFIQNLGAGNELAHRIKDEFIKKSEAWAV